MNSQSAQFLQRDFYSLDALPVSQMTASMQRW